MRAGERRLRTGDRVCYALVFLVLVFVLFFLDGR